MVPVKFKDANTVFGRPAGLPKDVECGQLHAKRTKGENYAQTESVFEMTEEELAIITKSKRIRIKVLGHAMPPIALMAEPQDPESESHVNKN